MRQHPHSATIGEVAHAAGVGVETVRYYERRGLIDKPPRPASGYRRYPPDTVDRLRFIRHAKELGFTLNEITDLLELRLVSDGRCDRVLGVASAKIADIDRRIGQLRRMRRTLATLTAACRRDRPTTECPILNAMKDELDTGPNATKRKS